MLNLAEEAKFAEFRRMGSELGVPVPPEVFINLKVHSRHGDLIFDDTQRGHSWTRNFYNMIFALSCDSPGSNSNNFGAGYETGKATTGTIYYTNTREWGRLTNVLATIGFFNDGANDTFGVMAGTGDTAFSAEQVTLVTPIVHGTGAGQMSYAAMPTPTIAYTGGTKTWAGTLARAFTNSSGGAITVKETGLYWYGYSHTATTGLYFMMERTVLSPTVAVADGAQLTVTYSISMAYTAID
jgi:hypothetical protein